MNQAIRKLVAVALTMTAAATATAATFQAGVATVDITPDTSKLLMGYVGAYRWAEPGKYHDPQAPTYDSVGISIRAVYIARPDGSEPIVMVAADTSHLCPSDSEYARDPSRYSIPFITRERILINVIHTHTSVASCDKSVLFIDPVMTADAQPGSEWRTSFRAKLIEAVQSAYDHRQPANLWFMRNKINIGSNRRTNSQADLTDATGTSIVASHGYDQTLDVIEIYRDDLSRIGMLMFYGAHPVILRAGTFPDGKYHYHADYPGFARKYIEDATVDPNDVAILFQAGGGDVNGSGVGYTACRARGEELGQRVLQMSAESVIPANVITEPILPGAEGLTAYSRVWPLHLQTAVGNSRLGGQYGEPRGLASPAATPGQLASNEWFRWADYFCNSPYGHGGGNPRCGDSPRGVAPTTLDTEVQTFGIGNWRVAGLSHDMVGMWGAELRQHWPAQRVSVAGYIRSLENYLATSNMVNSDDSCSCGYEGSIAEYLTSNPSPWATFATTGRQYDLDTELHDALRLARTRMNFALALNGATVHASSTTLDSEYPGQGLTFPARSVIDGDRRGVNWEHGGGWRDGNSGFPDWLEVDFGVSRAIDEINVFTVQDNYAAPSEPTQTLTFSSYGLTAFDVQYWNGSQWMTVGSVQANAKVWRRFTFAPITTTRIRIWIGGALAGRSRVTEVEAWGTPTTRSNVALHSAGATVYTSSDTSSSEFPGLTFPASAVIDGDRRGVNWGHGGGWRDGNETFPDWIEVVFAGLQRIDEIDVFGVQNAYYAPADPDLGMFATNYALVDFQVQYWNGSQWVVAGSVSGNDKVWQRFVFKPVTTDRIRLYITNALNTNEPRSRVVEVEAWGMPMPRPNVALASNGATVHASSTTLDSEYPGRGLTFPASAVIDGDRRGANWEHGGGWRDGNNEFPDWLEVDFAGARTIDEIDVFTLQDSLYSPVAPDLSTTFSLYGVTEYQVQIWDGSGWLTKGSTSGNNKVWRRFVFEPVTTTKIRVLITHALFPGDPRSRLIEVEAY